jgi:regulator of chromosome condensation
MPGAIQLPEKVTCVAAGGSQTFAVTLSGKVYGWGCYKDKEGKQWFDAVS